MCGAAESDGSTGRRIRRGVGAAVGGRRAEGTEGISFGRQAGGRSFDDGGQICSVLTGCCFCYDESAAPRKVIGGVGAAGGPVIYV